MDSRLFMEIGVINTTFQAVDKTPFERWINDGILDNNHSHVILQRLLSIHDGDNNEIAAANLTIADTVDELRDSWEVNDISNGLYYYQKIVLPTQDHTVNSNEILWYNTDSQKVYYYDTDLEQLTEYNPWNDFDDIYSILREEYPDNCFYFDDYSFSIYGLVECYVMTERERINNYLKNNCRSNCNNRNNDNLNEKADILLAAIMVIKHLMEKGDFFEAQRILNGLNTCGNLCKKYMNTLKNCGCGGS